MYPPRGSESVRRTCKVPASRSRSSHLRPWQFAVTEPGSNGHDVEGCQPILSRRLEESPDLFAVQRSYLFSAGTWWLHRRSGIAGYQAVVRGLLECLAKSPVDVQDGAQARPPFSFSR
jgi:hypothetical protein